MCKLLFTREVTQRRRALFLKGVVLNRGYKGSNCADFCPNSLHR